MGAELDKIAASLYLNRSAFVRQILMRAVASTKEAAA
jgi:hypothetical protein